MLSRAPTSGTDAVCFGMASASTPPMDSVAAVSLPPVSPVEVTPAGSTGVDVAAAAIRCRLLHQCFRQRRGSCRRSLLSE